MKRNELVSQLHPLINQPGLHDFMLLLVVCIEDWKSELVEAKGDTVLELQGAIKRVKSLLIDLRREPKKQEFKDGGYVGE